MEDDYLKSSQFPYNSHQFPSISIRNHQVPNNWYQSRRSWDGEYDRQEILKMVNEVSEKIKDLTESHKAISKKVKVLAESNKVMNEELSRLQEVLENMMKEKLQSLDLTD